MTYARTDLAAGEGWRIADVTCTAGPDDPAYEERHGDTCIALVQSGTFQYRSTEGRATLTPGAVILGQRGQCFECGHEHGFGDRCIAFHYSDETMDTAFSAMPDARPADMRRTHLPPLDALTPAFAAAQAAAGDGTLAKEELALSVLGHVLARLREAVRPHNQPSARDARRVADAIRRIEQHCDESIALDRLARDAGMSRFHFLRQFCRIVGMTPHQYVLRMRLNRAAVAIGTTDRPIADIAFDNGFGDLSTFNRRFKTILGVSPSAWRRSRAALAPPFAR